MASIGSLPPGLLPRGVRSRFVATAGGLRMHILEAGHERDGRPVVLLVHGFPELAWSWRKVMPALAAAGFRVVAPDQRGYGRTTGWDADYDADLAPYRPLGLAQDLIDLAAALDLRDIRAVVGHDVGSSVAAHCALVRPDLFTSLVMMSAPFAGPPLAAAAPAPPPGLNAALGRLTPPRQHYQWYYSTRRADGDLRGAPQGLHDFLRAYYHVKSAAWPGNQPRPLLGWTAAELARLPPYYVMPTGASMPETVAPYLPAPSEAAACAWLTESELDVYRAEFARTGFQGGLQWYRCATGGLTAADLRQFAGRPITVPAIFIAGTADWGTYQAWPLRAPARGLHRPARPPPGARGRALGAAGAGRGGNRAPPGLPVALGDGSAPGAIRYRK
jgi:pimeloyl-ACP methyl ester carboxylesterase